MINSKGAETKLCFFYISEKDPKRSNLALTLEETVNKSMEIRGCPFNKQKDMKSLSRKRSLRVKHARNDVQHSR